jgi:hypothetical protein
LNVERCLHQQGHQFGWLIRAVLLALLIAWPGMQFVASAAEVSTAPATVFEAEAERPARDDSTEYYRARLTLNAAMQEAEAVSSEAGETDSVSASVGHEE